MQKTKRKTGLYKPYYNLIEYVLPVNIVLGIIGNLFNIVIFTRRQLQKQSCTRILLVQSIINICYIILNQPVNTLAEGYHIDLRLKSNTFCKLYFYMSYVLLLQSEWLLVLACIDRWTSSSLNAQYRRFSQLKTTKYTIPGILTICCLLFSHVPWYYQIQTGSMTSVCAASDIVYNRFLQIFYMTVYSILSPIVLIVFGLLTIENVRQQRRRILPQEPTVFKVYRRRDRQVIKLISIQTITFIVVVSPLGMMSVLNALTLPTPLIQLNIRKLFLLREFLKVLNQIFKRLLGLTIIERHFLQQHQPTFTFQKFIQSTNN
ncbi:unnamed protein product [Didymodactylos carnosus]|uniref:G-protein coupled receptors family 1 profile domain-containing protein n=1 Tax=Didymodactylos carnosus TaxID=1234261 RepID=A0A814DDH1_9BILA|nr:unnamed protein product [Didymodactylos carnosus]CAF0954289.1 unnamed protein product [Didymodactylos carnosus]CAF3619822.1 unnamed protein product [Didymodactylos carnosus]CAF3729600.1 unnamed protein product [Didymodactylos carnosus]